MFETMTLGLLADGFLSALWVAGMEPSTFEEMQLLFLYYRVQWLERFAGG